MQTAGELAQLEVALSDGRRLRLDQVAKVHDTVAEPRSAALLEPKDPNHFERVLREGIDNHWHPPL